VNLKSAYDYFEKYRKLPVVMVNSQGKYVYTAPESSQHIAQTAAAKTAKGN
jgi:hypothetical protein